MKYKIQFMPVLFEFKEAKHALEEELKTWGLPFMDMMDILLAVDESITNIILHGYGEIHADDYIQLEVSGDRDSVLICIADTGREFDFDATPPPDIRKNLSGNKKGGFGVHLIKSVMNTVEHTRQNNVNILTLTKRFKPVT